MAIDFSLFSSHSAIQYGTLSINLIFFCLGVMSIIPDNTGAVSPLYALIEAQQLKDLAKGKASYVNKKTF